MKQDIKAPAEKLVNEVKGYTDAQIDCLKLRTAKGLAQGTSALVATLLIFILGSALVLVLSFGCVMWLGEILGSYAGAAFIVAGVLALAVAIIALAKKYLFKNSFVPMYVTAFFPESKVKDIEGLDMETMQATVRVYKKEADITKAYMKAKDYYTPSRLLGNELSGNIIPKLLKFLGK